MMIPCHWCWAMVTQDWALKHAEWHRANDLHAADCALLKTRKAQRSTGAFLLPQPCTCGVVQTESDVASNGALVGHKGDGRGVTVSAAVQGPGEREGGEA